MSFCLTTKDVAATYEYLRRLPPFGDWELPPAYKVKFHISRSKHKCGQHWVEGDTHHIEVSDVLHGHLINLIHTVAHEMCHMKDKSRSHHGKTFQALASRVCEYHGFDQARFFQ